MFNLISKIYKLVLVLLFLSTDTSAQFIKLPKEQLQINKPIFMQKAYVPILILNPTVKSRFLMPKNKLMYWPSYSLTATEIERNAQKTIENRKMKNMIANEVITTIFSKKKIIAVKPQF